MSENIGWAELGVRPDTSGFGTSLSRQIDPTMSDVGRRTGARFSAGFKRAAVIGGIGVATALTAGIKLAVSSLDEARESQKVAAQTNAVLKSTGGIARVSAKDVGHLAGQLSRKAGIDDELIQSGENVLLTFKDVRNEVGKNNDIFNQGTSIALDMSAALGTDLQGSVIQVGKALNDPIKGITALQRVGVTFTDQQKEQIKALSESGDKLGAQKLILRELTSEFKGSAKSQATESDRLDVAFGNLKETIGKELLPYMDDLQKFIRKEGIPAVKDFFHWFEDTGVPALKKTGHFLKDAGGHAKDLIGFLKDLPDPAKYAGLIALVGGVGVAKLRSGGGALGGAGSALGLSAPVKVFVTNPGFGAGGGVPGSPGSRGPGAAAFLVAPKGGQSEKDAAFARVMKRGNTSFVEDFANSARLSAQFWHDYEFNGVSAFKAVDKAIENATPLMVRYNRVLDGTPRQIKTWVGLSGYEKAIGQINTLQAGIDALAGRGLDNGVPYVHGGTRSSGVNVNIGTVHVKDGRDLLNKSQQAALGGRRAP